MLLYRHSARCPTALRWFLHRYPIFWSLVPMPTEQAFQDNAHYQLPSTIPTDPSSPIPTDRHQRSDHQAGTMMTKLPPVPSEQYSFSLRQCAEQFQLFKNERERFTVDHHLDLCNATIIAVCM